jgi:broad specificity phosphatase PhoE
VQGERIIRKRASWAGGRAVIVSARSKLFEDPRVTTFHLIRHGEHTLLGRVLAGRMPGVGLSERGRAEARWVAARLAGEKIAALYASPMQRTRETAAIIAEALGLPVGTREDAIELDFGEWTGATFDSVRGDPRWPLWSSHRSIATLPGGESMRAVQERIVAALFDLHAAHPHEEVALVSHGDVIRAALLFALGMPLDFYSRIEVAPASISTIRLDDGGIRVIAVNERPRLAENK